MKVHRALDGQVAILRPKGDLTGGPETEDLVTTVKGLVGTGNRALLVDLGDVPLVTSLGLSAFIRVSKSYAEKDGKVMLCNLTRRNHTLFETVKLSFLFDVHESEREGIHALGGWLHEHTVP
jgi:anti-anti-sigma factor